MKDKYFENIIGIGDLWIDQIIFFENDCPILFVCSDICDNLYLCVCYDVIESQKWLLVKVAPVELLEMLYNRVTFYNMFKKENGNAWLIEWDDENKKDVSKIVDSIALSDEILPTEGVYMDRDEEDYCDYINQLNLKHNFEFCIPYFKKITASTFSLNLKNSIIYNYVSNGPLEDISQYSLVYCFNENPEIKSMKRIMR